MLHLVEEVRTYFINYWIPLTTGRADITEDYLKVRD